MKLPVQIQRSVIQQIASSSILSNRYIADLYKISPTTISKLRLKFQQSGKTWDELAPLSDHEFKVQLGTFRQYRRENPLVHPDYSMIHQEMKIRDMTLKLLHYEYLEEMQDNIEQAISYSTFAHTYHSWLTKQKISMRQVHRPGEKMFIDFCGKTMPVKDPTTGAITKAQIFVAILGASGYTFIYAVPSQKQVDWLTCHIEAFQFFEGVPKYLVPDNLKSAVIHHKKDSILLNQSYACLAEHYQCAILPARRRKPKDKSLAEIMVQIVQRWILAALRKQEFFSFEELNQVLSQKLEILNNKKTKSFPHSRSDNFLNYESQALMSLPEMPYQMHQWKYNIKIPYDYHVEYENHLYSVPYHYIGQLVNIRATQTSIEILLGNYRIATHIRKFEHGISTHFEHQPLNHQSQTHNTLEALLEWSSCLGKFGKEWVCKNLQQRKDLANGLKAVSQLRRWLQEEQQYDYVEPACEFALQYNQLGFQKLLDAIKNKKISEKYSRTITTTPSANDHENLRGSDYYKLKENQ
ncbi:IS21 family transposase [Wohlfahrtiimonas populi]|uniref:IS21 family transposase n=1 Tax=Wohlfahrtiimonas populi TaxID=1940240 RepID=UPI00098D6105|nr:IS21 family transposase [Wohlfahrtiimonas populi]